MKIADSAVQFLSEKTAVEQHQKRESLTLWGPGEDRATFINNAGQGQKIDVQNHIASLQESVKVSLSEEAVKSRPVQAVAEPVSEEQELMADLNIRILKALIERMTGKRLKILSADDLQLKNGKEGNGAAGLSEIVEESGGGVCNLQ